MKLWLFAILLGLALEIGGAIPAITWESGILSNSMATIGQALGDK